MTKDWTGKSMNNLLSYCGLVDPRISAQRFTCMNSSNKITKAWITCMNSSNKITKAWIQISHYY